MADTVPLSKSIARGDSTTPGLKCRLCGSPLHRTFVDLGMSPPCESFRAADQVDQAEVTYPLHVRICENCLLVQLPEYINPAEIFSDYAYFSSYSASWVEHARTYARAMTSRLGLGPTSLVVEAASNDGYLLQHFNEWGIPVLGIEPAANVAAAARERGVRTEVAFLGSATGAAIAAEYGSADLVIGNNVFAHVPDIVDFAAGLRALVAPHGVVTLEFPHLLRLIERKQYDTIYHEHYSYLSLLTATRALETASLQVFDVEELQSHGGSLRVFAQPLGGPHPVGPAVQSVLAEERAAGLHSLEGHSGFASAVAEIKFGFLEYLIDCARRGISVAGYGAPGKGNTLLNHCGVRTDLLSYTVDRNPYKHGRFLPGSQIPIFPPEHLAETRPDRIVILPWNLRREIATQLAYTAEWSARLVVPIPALEEFLP
jgi:SAM-dependent methyltransferase